MKRVLFQINVTANWGSTGKIAEQIGQCASKLPFYRKAFRP